MMLRMPLLVLCLFLLAVLPSTAQEVRLSAGVDKQEISIGDWITLHLEVTAPKGATIAWPSFAEKLKGFEIVREGKPVSVSTGVGETTSLDIVLTSFDAGKLTLPALEVQYSDGSSTTPRILQSKPFDITVRGVHVDTK